MSRAIIDPCGHIPRKMGRLVGALIPKVHDSMYIGTERFIIHEAEASHRYKSKPREILSRSPTPCNGYYIHRTPTGDIRMFQSDKITLLTPPDTEKCFVSQRAMAQYIGVKMRPYITASVQLVTSAYEPIT